MTSRPPANLEDARRRRAAVENWAPPQTLEAPPLPDFPAKRLPTVLRDMVEAVAREVQTPVALPGMLALGIGASTIAGKTQAIGRPGHVEELPLWTFVASESAERKTPAYNLLRRPLDQFEMECAPQVLLERQREQFRLKVVQATIAKLEKAAISSGTNTAVMAELEAALAEEQAIRVPPEMRLWVSSPTPEAVHDLLAKHDGRMAVFSDEGGLFGIIAGRYAGKGGSADMDPFLSGYNGSPLRAPRVTAERKDVPAAFLTMGFAVQPTILADLGAVAGAEDRGLVGRFLFALPTSKVGTRPYGGSTPVPDQVARAYAKAVTTWASLPVPLERHQLRLADDAYQAYADFHDRIEKRLAPGEDLASIGSWGGKIAGTTLRVAAVLHVFDHPSALHLPISLETISDAAAMTEEFFIPHAFAAFRVMRHGAAKSVRQRLQTWITAHRLERFTLRQAFQQMKGGAGGRVQSPADLEPALLELEAAGFVRRDSGSRSDSVLFEVNPLWQAA